MRDSSNPVFRSVEKGNTQSYTNAATFAGISIKTGVLLLVAVLSAFGANLLIKTDQIAPLVTILGVSGIVGFIAVLIGIMVPRLSGPFAILYAAAEGFMLGTITILLNQVLPGIGLTAVTATAVIFGVMLLLYSSRTLRATNRFKKTMYSMILGILIFSLLSVFIAPLRAIYDNPFLGVVLSIFFIGYGAFMLILDFDRAEYIVSSGADKKYEWSVSLGLMVTIVWIYIEVLRLLVILFANKE